MHGLDLAWIALVVITASPGAMGLGNKSPPQGEIQAHAACIWAACFIRGTARILDMDTEMAVKDPR